MQTLITATNAVVGDEMSLLKDSYLLVEDERIIEVGSGTPPHADRTIPLKKCIIIPGLINAHTHIGDSAFQDIGVGKTLDELFKPPNGLKYRLLESTSQTSIKKACRDTIIDMLSAGITTFADFREGGVDGVKILRQALEGLKIRALIFGRPSYTFQMEKLEANTGPLPENVADSIEQLSKLVDGYAPSAPNDVTDELLKQLDLAAKRYGKLRATHAAEHSNSSSISKERAGVSEVKRALEYLEADFLVHLTYAEQEDLDLVAKQGVSVVCCPSANSALGLRLPPIQEMLERKINVALGTDNVMLNPPDMLREMAFVMKAYRIGAAKNYLTPKEILMMATINGARTLKIDYETGSIKEGKLADIVALDFDSLNLRYTNDILAAVVHRARPDNVELVMINGEVAYDGDLEVRRGTVS